MIALIVLFFLLICFFFRLFVVIVRLIKARFVNTQKLNEKFAEMKFNKSKIKINS